MSPGPACGRIRDSGWRGWPAVPSRDRPVHDGVSGASDRPPEVMRLESHRRTAEGGATSNDEFDRLVRGGEVENPACPPARRRGVMVVVRVIGDEVTLRVDAAHDLWIASDRTPDDEERCGDALCPEDIENEWSAGRIRAVVKGESYPIRLGCGAASNHGAEETRSRAKSPPSHAGEPGQSRRFDRVEKREMVERIAHDEAGCRRKTTVPARAKL